MRHRSLLILLFLAGGAEGLAAQEPTSERLAREPVTEALFLAALDEAHPASRALAGDLGAAEARRLQAALLADPRLEVTREAPENVARETTWGVAWTPPIDGRRRKAIHAAGAGVDVEAHRLEGRLLELRSEVRAAYAAWAVGEARVSLLGEHNDRLEVLARRMRDRANAGEESVLAAWRMEIALRSSQMALAEARAAGTSWRERSAAWLVVADRDLRRMQPRLPELPQAPADLSAETRPDVRAARSRVEQAESLEQLSGRVLEAPEILFGWKRIENDPGGGGRDLDGSVLAIGWRIPLFDRRQAERLAAKSAVATAAADEEWATKRAHGELLAALAAYDELRRSAGAAGRDLEILSGTARAAAASFEQGESTVTDLLDTLRALLESRLIALDLYAAALEAQRRLEVAAGRALISGDLS